MILEHYPADKLKQEILDILGRHLDLSEYRVFFFGSRVDGTSSEGSDIDIGIDGPEPVPDDRMQVIKFEFEILPTLYTIDVVDFSRVSGKFREVALQKIELVKP